MPFLGSIWLGIHVLGGFAHFEKGNEIGSSLVVVNQMSKRTTRQLGGQQDGGI